MRYAITQNTEDDWMNECEQCGKLTRNKTYCIGCRKELKQLGEEYDDKQKVGLNWKPSKNCNWNDPFMIGGTIPLDNFFIGADWQIIEPEKKKKPKRKSIKIDKELVNEISKYTRVADGDD